MRGDTDLATRGDGDWSCRNDGDGLSLGVKPAGSGEDYVCMVTFINQSICAVHCYCVLARAAVALNILLTTTARPTRDLSVCLSVSLPVNQCIASSQTH